MGCCKQPAGWAGAVLSLQGQAGPAGLQAPPSPAGLHLSPLEALAERELPAAVSSGSTGTGRGQAFLSGPRPWHSSSLPRVCSVLLPAPGRIRGLRSQVCLLEWLLMSWFQPWATGLYSHSWLTQECYPVDSTKLRMCCHSREVAILVSVAPALISLIRRRQYLRCEMDVVFFYSWVESLVVGENSRFKLHPSCEVVTVNSLMKSEFLPWHGLEKNLRA